MWQSRPRGYPFSVHSRGHWGSNLPLALEMSLPWQVRPFSATFSDQPFVVSGQVVVINLNLKLNLIFEIQFLLENNNKYINKKLRIQFFEFSFYQNGI